MEWLSAQQTVYIVTGVRCLHSLASSLLLKTSQIFYIKMCIIGFGFINRSRTCSRAQCYPRQFEYFSASRMIRRANAVFLLSFLLLRRSAADTSTSSKPRPFVLDFCPTECEACPFGVCRWQNQINFKTLVVCNKKKNACLSKLIYSHFPSIPFSELWHATFILTGHSATLITTLYTRDIESSTIESMFHCLASYMLGCVCTLGWITKWWTVWKQR